MALTSAIVKTPNVTVAQRESMLRLYRRYFSNVRRDTFLSDLTEKDWVIVLRAGDEIVGFSTLKTMPLELDGVEHVFLFSGDTLIDRKHWIDNGLAGSFGHFILRLIDEHSNTPLHWFLISKGYRTYRSLPVYFKRFYPVFSEETPPEYAKLLRAVACHRFNDAYDPDTGLVRLGSEQDRLRPEMSVVPEGREADPHVRFFLERNPAFGAGDELACIADISRENLNRRAWRVVERTKVAWHE